MRHLALEKSPMIPLLAGGLCLVAAMVAGFFPAAGFRADDLRHLVPARLKTDRPSWCEPWRVFLLSTGIC